MSDAEILTPQWLDELNMGYDFASCADTTVWTRVYWDEAAGKLIYEPVDPKEIYKDKPDG